MPLCCTLPHHGGTDVLQWHDVDPGPPAAGELLIAHTAVGVNYIDIYHRSGLYPLPMPSGIGLEAAGRVIAVGDGVSGFAPGERVAYASAPVGAYAEQRRMPAERVVHLPDTVSDSDAAALMLKGLTAHFLLFRTFRVQAGDHIVVHSAAGGVGSLLCRWARHIGAQVIGTVGDAGKAATAEAAGCERVIDRSREDVAAAVREATAGVGAAVVYDGIGADTFRSSLDCLAPLGMMVSFGNASGPIAAFAPSELATRGSLFFTRPSLLDYIRRNEDLTEGAAAVFRACADGVLQAQVQHRYPLREAARAHEALESGRTTGASVLLPEG